MTYLGDFAEAVTINFLWSTNSQTGASVTRTVDGTVSVYKDNSDTQSVAGVSGTEDFDGVTGIHLCTIDTSADAFYSPGSDYSVVLSAATIAGETVNAVLASFSIKNRFTSTASIIYNPNGSTLVHAAETNDHTFTATDDGTYWQLDDVPTDPIEIEVDLDIGAARVGVALHINGRFSSGASRVVNISVYNYSTLSWDQLSNGSASTTMRNSANDRDYVFGLSYGHTKHTAVVGEMKLKFLADTYNGADTLYLDLIAVTAVGTGAAASITAEEIANTVWSHAAGNDVSQHTSKFTGQVWYVDGTNGAPTNSGRYTTEAFDQFGEAFAAASAGDRIIGFAGTYAEAGLDMNVDGLELMGERGTILTGGGGGTCLVASADSCRINGIWTTPGAGQIGFDITGTDVGIEHCESYGGGATGFRTAAAGAEDVHINDSDARGYTSEGFNLRGATANLSHCIAETDQAGTRGFYLSNTAAHRCAVHECISIGNETASFATIVGADENVFHHCSQSKDCGDYADAGTDNAWPNFMTNPLDTDSAGAIGGMSVAALADLFNVDSGETYASSVAGSVVKEASGVSMTIEDTEINIT